MMVHVHVHSTLGFGENEQCPKPVFYSLHVEHCTFCKAKKNIHYTTVVMREITDHCKVKLKYWEHNYVCISM